MAYFLSETASGQPNLTAKNRVWGFFGESVSVCLETRRSALEPHQENYDVSRKAASGIPLWPSRDPIGERGGVNLYGFVGNDGINEWELLGLMTLPDAVHSCSEWFASEFGEEQIRNRRFTEFTAWVLSQAANVEVRVYVRSRKLFEIQEVRTRITQEMRICATGMCDSDGNFSASANVEQTRPVDRWTEWSGINPTLISETKEFKTIRVGGAS